MEEVFGRGILLKLLFPSWISLSPSWWLGKWQRGKLKPKVSRPFSWPPVKIPFHSPSFSVTIIFPLMTRLSMDLWGAFLLIQCDFHSACAWSKWVEQEFPWFYFPSHDLCIHRLSFAISASYNMFLTSSSPLARFQRDCFIHAHLISSSASTNRSLLVTLFHATAEDTASVLSHLSSHQGPK